MVNNDNSAVALEKTLYREKIRSNNLTVSPPPEDAGNRKE